jgi:type II restriction enzyme
MILKLSTEIAGGYSTRVMRKHWGECPSVFCCGNEYGLKLQRNIRAQRGEVRVMMEHWVNRSGFCPNCGSGLSQFENNTPVADFYCGNCSEEYELKYKNGNVGKKIVDGAYSTMIERLESDNNPNFFFLTYDKSTLGIRNFLSSHFEELIPV